VPPPKSASGQTLPYSRNRFLEFMRRAIAHQCRRNQEADIDVGLVDNFMQVLAGAGQNHPAAGNQAKIPASATPGYQLVWPHVIPLQRVIEGEYPGLDRIAYPRTAFVLADDLDTAYSFEGFLEAVVIGQQRPDGLARRLQVEGCAKSMNALIVRHLLDDDRFFRGRPIAGREYYTDEQQNKRKSRALNFIVHPMPQAVIGGQYTYCSLARERNALNL
jgi:hypothetical protein